MSKGQYYCKISKCPKSFNRKAPLLHHLKYDHFQGQTLDDELLQSLISIQPQKDDQGELTGVTEFKLPPAKRRKKNLPYKAPRISPRTFPKSVKNQLPSIAKRQRRNVSRAYPNNFNLTLLHKLSWNDQKEIIQFLNHKKPKMNLTRKYDLQIPTKGNYSQILELDYQKQSWKLTKQILLKT